MSQFNVFLSVICITCGLVGVAMFLRDRTAHGPGLVGLLCILIPGSALAAEVLPGSGSAVLSALKTRLPKTEVSSVDCGKIAGLCEVVAGKSLFYVDRGARYLIVGRLYDMETRQDLTAARLLEINPDALLGGAARSGEDAGDDPQALAAAQAGRPVAAGYALSKRVGQAGAGQTVSLASLPVDGAIRWGSGAQTVTIFTDFRCGYCRALVGALETMNVKVVERPISVMGTRELSNRVYCAKNKSGALRAAYSGDELPAVRCNTSGLDANEKFARDHGFSGTPVIVRSDGAVLHGYRPKEFLANWLKGAKS